MLISDRLYGKFEIDSPVLIELINSPSVQRLKGIGQYGVPDEFYNLKNFSRFEHSVGVMLLLKRLGADEEEQIAGLLHDASHTAFSHVIDYLVGSTAEENYQDINHLQRLSRTELGSILGKHGYSLETISDYHCFGLLEQPTPEICADRLDYALREFPKNSIKYHLDGLTTVDGKIVFKDKIGARFFAEKFLGLQQTNWGGVEAVNRFRDFAEALQCALDSNCIVFDDFDRDDAYVTDKLKRCDNSRIRTILQALSDKDISHFEWNGEVIPKKFRHVDPLILDRVGTVRLSETDEDWAIMLEKARQKNLKGVPLYKI